MDATTPANPTLRELLAAPVSIAVGSGSIQVRPMGWYQGSEALEVLLPVIDQMPAVAQPDGSFAPGKAEAWLLFAVAHRDEVAAFCAVASGLAEADIRELQPTLLIELLLGLLEVNADFFVQSLPVLAQRAAGRLAAIQAAIVAANQAAIDLVATTDSQDVFAELIAAGHSFAELKHYTPAQTRWFLAAAQRADRRARRQAFTAMRIAQCTDSKLVRDYDASLAD